jgi:hypothetical protein
LPKTRDNVEQGALSPADYAGGIEEDDLQELIEERRTVVFF